jgi:PHS family inorganic phosphate transporter-like MFS transporter
MLGYLYGHALPGPQLNTAQSLGIKVATPVGNIFGQLIFGWLADHVGRKRMCMYSPGLHILLLISLADGVELMIIIVATFAQALSGSADAVSIIGVLIVWRFIVSRHPFLLTRLTPSSAWRWYRW